MATRDPNKTARNLTISEIKDKLRANVSDVLTETGYASEQSLNAFIGSKAGDFIELKTEVIRSPEEYISKWLSGMQEAISAGQGGRYQRMNDFLKNPAHPKFRKYCELFLRRSYLNHYEELSKTRPHEEDAYYWFGVNDAHYGLFITPRYITSTGEWENDVSEIRAFDKTYWTIGHILKTGICIPNDPNRYFFSRVDDYLSFFLAQVRLTKSPYQIEFARLYIDFVKNSTTPERVPLLIPEIRFDGHGRKHTYRLDFLIVNPYTLDKIGIEFSPWSTHGQLSGKHKTLIELNDEAKGNFEKEIKKLKAYFNKFGIFTMVYTDEDLKDVPSIFNQIKPYLNPTSPPTQLSLNLIHDYFGR
jgi:hypothetical protein